MRHSALVTRWQRTRLIVTALALGLLVPLAVAPPAHASGTVTVTVVGQGTASGEGVSCSQSGGPDCSEFYADTSYQECDPERKPPCVTIYEAPYVELTAGPDTNGYAYQGWVGCETVVGRTCGLTVTTDAALTATFADVQPPSVGSLSPSSGVQRGSITLAAGASDNSSVDRVEFRVRGVLVGTDVSAPYGIEFDTSTVADGQAALRATAFDDAGLSSFAESSVTIDNTAPTVTITSGPDGQVVGAGTTQTWTFSAVDPASGIASVRCSVVPLGTPRSFGTCSGGNASHSVTGLPGGTHEFAVRARDNGGLQRTVTRKVTVDVIRPTITNPSPGSGGWTRDRTPLVKATLKDQIVSGVSGSVDTGRTRLYLDGTSRSFEFAAPTLSWQAPRLSYGRHDVKVVAFDQVGNRTVGKWWFEIRR